MSHALLSPFVAVVISMGVPTPKPCETLLTGNLPDTVQIWADAGHQNDPAIERVRQNLVLNLDRLLQLGFRPRPFDVLLDFEGTFKSRAKSDPDFRFFQEPPADFNPPWTDMALRGPSVWPRDGYALAMHTDRPHHIRPLKGSSLYLPLHTPNNRRLAETSFAVAHELGHLTEPDYLHSPRHFFEATPDTLPLGPWQEARASLIDYLTTGNEYMHEISGMGLTYSMGWPTRHHIREVGLKFEDHDLGQLIGHVLLEISKAHDGQWLADLIQLMDRKLGPDRFSVRHSYSVAYDFDVHAADFPQASLAGIPANYRNGAQEALRNQARLEYQGMAFTFENFLEAAVETGATPQQVEQARLRMRNFGFPSRKLRATARIPSPPN